MDILFHVLYNCLSVYVNIYKFLSMLSLYRFYLKFFFYFQFHFFHIFMLSHFLVCFIFLFSFMHEPKKEIKILIDARYAICNCQAVT